MKKSCFCFLLILCVLLCAFPAAAFADSGERLQAGDHIDYGVFQDKPVCWLVLDPEHQNTGDPGAFLLTQYVVQGSGVYYNWDYAIWKGSLGQEWCTDFAQTAFSDAERAMIPAVDKQEEPVTAYGLMWGTADLEQEQVFFLSTRECMEYIAPEDGGPGLSGYTEDGTLVYWWFRTPHGTHPDYAGLVLDMDQVHDNLVMYGWGGRPATNLDLDRVILLIPSEGEGAPVGELNAPRRPEDGRWKAIVPDESRALRITAAEKDGRDLLLHYAGAVPGEGSYLSLLACDEEGRELLYGRLAACTEEEGELLLSQSMGLPEGARLYLFNEQEGGEHRSNLSSPLCPVNCTLTISAGAGSGSMEALNLPYGSSFTLPESGFTPPEGQVFDHWELNDRPVDGAEALIVSGDGVLTAVYRGEDEAPKASGAPVSSSGSVAVDTVRNLSAVSTVTKVLILGVPLLLIVLVLFLAINSGRRRR